MTSFTSLPRDILFTLLAKQTDLKSIVSYAMTCKATYDIFLESNIIRKFAFPNSTAREACCSQNLVMMTQQRNTHLCIVCVFCHEIIPVHLSAIMVSHRCKMDLYPFAKFTNQHNVLYNNNTGHLCVPEPCSDLTLSIDNVPRPNVFPYQL